MSMEKYLNDIIDAIIQLKAKELTELSVKAIDAGVPALEVVNQALTVGLRKVGDLFADEQIFLPELVQAGNMVAKTMEAIKPYLAAGEVGKRRSLLLIATVAGDVHDIGKNLVCLLFSASGYEVIDLGKDVPTNVIAEKVAQLNPDILGLSALLSTTMPEQQKVIEVIEETGLRDRVKIMVGGAPVTRRWAEKIGADGFAEDAASAVKEADRILGLN
jgi:corrinoid protein of di/trimethylamine methyltransferase